MRTTFPDTFGLAELPWFEVKDDRILADPELGPILDMHTHLALNLFPRLDRVDLQAADRPTQHYLPLGRVLDLDCYCNRNFSPGDLRRLKWDLTLQSLYKGGMRATHTIPNLLQEMDELQIRASVVLAIELKRFSRNTERYLDINPDPERLLIFGSVHPLGKDRAGRLDRQLQGGIRGVKIHPAVQAIPPDHPAAMEVYALCAERDLPVLWHGGPVGIEGRKARRCSQLKHYWRAVLEHPGTTFILGHAGALQWEMGLELAQRYDNVYLELSGQGLPAIRRILAEGPAERILYGSDWPFYHQAIPVAKVAIATEGRPAERRRVLWENGARLLGLEG